MASVPTYQQSVAKPRAQAPSRNRAQWIREVYRHRSLLLLIPETAYLIVFHYPPLYGMTLALKEFDVYKGILGSRDRGRALERRGKQQAAVDR